MNNAKECKQMKKIKTYLLTVVLMGCMLTACGSAGTDTNQGTSDESADVTTNGEVVEGESPTTPTTNVAPEPTATLEPEPTDTPKLEIVKNQVQVDVTNLAKAYSNYMYNECMELSATFGLFDITGDGIPELFSGQGADVVTYWQGECWSLVCDMILLTWYYNEETQEPGCYYYWEYNGTVDEWIQFYTIDTTIGEYPCEWVGWSEQIAANIDLTQYTYIDGQFFDKEANKDAGMMEETLKTWFECQEEYEYIY